MFRWRMMILALVVIGAGIHSVGARRHGLMIEDVSKTDVTGMIKERVLQIDVDQPQVFGSLAMFPVTGGSIPGLRYLTLDEAMDAGYIRVGEIGSGEVNRVRVQNLSESRIFIMDGEEIVGAKQDRVINISVMMAPKQVVDVPVSCVEQRRWVQESTHFASGKAQLFAEGRRANVAAVSRNYAATPAAGGRSDQGEIWNRVAAKREAFLLSDSSGPMHEVYEFNRKRVSDYAEHFKAVKDQVGAVFAVGGRIVGADIFDQNRTLERLLDKIIKSYALDAIELEALQKNRAPAPDRSEAEKFLKNVLADGVSFRSYDSPGEGWDVRIDSPEICGAALAVSDRAVHIALFVQEDRHRPYPIRERGMAGSSERRRHLRER